MGGPTPAALGLLVVFEHQRALVHLGDEGRYLQRAYCPLSSVLAEGEVTAGNPPGPQ